LDERACLGIVEPGVIVVQAYCSIPALACKEPVGHSEGDGGGQDTAVGVVDRTPYLGPRQPAVARRRRRRWWSPGIRRVRLDQLPSTTLVALREQLLKRIHSDERAERYSGRDAISDDDVDRWVRCMPGQECVGR
jgi:hypothetical protein